MDRVLAYFGLALTVKALFLFWDQIEQIGLITFPFYRN